MSSPLPVVIIGAGPVGLAAAVHLRSRGLVPQVLEAGGSVGAGLRKWAHVRMFSPWEHNVDKRAAELLAAHGWTMPSPAHPPSGREMLDQYLEPLAALPELAPHIRLDARVTAVTKERHDRMKNRQRDRAAFLVRYVESGSEREVLASAVIDASGTLESPNPAGAAGIPALGELALRDRLFYGMPDLLGTDLRRYAGKRILVVGSGHSAFNVLAAAARLCQEAPATEIHWAVRRPSLRRVLGGGEKDQLAERGRMGSRIALLVESAAITAHTDVHIDRLWESPQGIVAWSADRRLPAVEEVIVVTGFRPDLSILSEMRLALDPGTESPTALAPLIDPNLHSCATVRPHGATELKHPDANLYVAGMKSYGRAPTFLLLTGYEQVRSIAAAIAGDWEAARRVELELPATGVCTSDPLSEEAPAVGCCGGPAPSGTDACCVADAEAQSSGAAGCGCGAKAAAAQSATLLMVNLPKLTPSSTPVPLPVRLSDTSPLVTTCASADWPAPAAAPALA
jgi:thioredoxin reductase